MITSGEKIRMELNSLEIHDYVREKEKQKVSAIDC